MSRNVSPAVFEMLKTADTSVVSNAIESFNVRMRNEGFIHGEIRCLFPELPPVAGYAVPARIRTSAPPIAGKCYHHRADFWEYVATIPAPRIIVVQDCDHNPGVGALFGEMHARIAEALECVGYVTNGTVRDAQGVRAARFACFAAGFSVSHSYAHLIEFGDPSVIGGLKISAGDLLHADENGVHSVPLSIAEHLPARVEEIRTRESKLIDFCRAPGFTLEKLATILREDEDSCQPPDRR